jgi:hypothetical protein
MLTALVNVKYGCCQMLDGLVSTHLKMFIVTWEWFSCMFEKNLAYGRHPEAIKHLLSNCTLYYFTKKFLKQKM